MTLDELNTALAATKPPLVLRRGRGKAEWYYWGVYDAVNRETVFVISESGREYEVDPGSLSIHPSQDSR